MRILINGQEQTLGPVSTVSHLLTQLGYEPNSVAVAIDGQFIARHRYPSFPVQENQAFDIVAPMQGG
jgi:thiamine biosynthesis protein ThiS